MIINYGYQDGSGEYFISIDTEKCNGCGKCVEVCPNNVLEIIPNEFDPFENGTIVGVVEIHRNTLKYSCAKCKFDHDKNEMPCVQACPQSAIKHF